MSRKITRQRFLRATAGVIVGASLSQLAAPQTATAKTLHRLRRRKRNPI